MSLVVDVRLTRGPLTLTVAFEAAAGEACAILGPNGAGKSTLLAIIAGLVRPDAGSVVLDGVALDRAGVALAGVGDAEPAAHVPARSRPIGVVFQDLLLFPHLSAVENAAFPLRARGVPADAARARALALLDRLGVAHRAAARPGALSGGEAQRVALARALIAQPRVLLLDEPLSALDRPARARIRALLGEVLTAFDGIVLLVTHDPQDARALADRVVVIEHGIVAHEGAVADVVRSPGDGFLGELLAKGDG
ncbi:MAG: ATP-binding cassette domain-containing protein [Ardenticatenales bacterium]